jgi:hypothetical protein
MNEEIVSVTGPVERIDDKLMLRIPLAVGGDRLLTCSKGISTLQDDFLCIEIMDWIAEKLSISEGSEVKVHNTGGKFNITPVLPSLGTPD